MTEAELNTITGCIINTSMQLHKALGPGLLESVYSSLLAYDLKEIGLRIARERPTTIVYKQLVIENAFRADLIVEEAIVVEVKSIERVLPVHKKQLITYVRILEMPIGLLINFGDELLKDGIRRVTNTHV